MGQIKAPGLLKRGEIWHVDKQILGTRLRESTGATTLAEANRYIEHRIEQIRQAKIYGIRPKRLFRDAAIKYLRENQHKRSFSKDVSTLKKLDTFIGDIPLDVLHRGSLEKFISIRQEEKVKNRTINHGLQIVRRILNLAAGEWIDDNGLSWLLSAPKIKLLPLDDARKPYPLSWEEQKCLFDILPHHLKQMALFAVNTGCRDHETCSLQWTWENHVPELNTSIFLIPATEVKNGFEKVVILNKIARRVVDAERGKNAKYVFTFRDKPIKRMLNSCWKRARQHANLPLARVHDLRHTFGRRLRAAGVSFEDRQDLLGHKSQRITTHYSAPELLQLLNAANKICKNTETS
jgi:integrase